MGFSLHADTSVHGHDRQGLERLCRYGSRGPVAESLTAPPRRRPVRVRPQGQGRLRPAA
ncbi:MAG: transposase [Myxococcaceae bacterium]|nr:transposase [Myxococcaceae bacterium]